MPPSIPQDHDTLGLMSRHLARLSVEVVLVPAHAVTQVLVEVDRLACLIDALTSPHHGHDLRPPVDPEDG